MATTYGLYCQYGNYVHESGEISMSYKKETRLTEANTPYAENTRITLDGLLTADGVASMDTKVRALRAAYAQHNQAFSFRTSRIDTALSIDPSDTLDGIRVVAPPSFDRMQRAAYGVILFYTIMLEADVLLSDRATDYLSYSETITKRGGGPRYGILETRRGLPVFQQLSAFTPYIAEQRGEAVGLFARPLPARAMWPVWQLENRELTLKSPNRSSNNFYISWSYSFASPLPLLGNPHRYGTF